MKPSVFENLMLIRERVQTASHVLIGLDYDGTLTPIVDDPWKAKVCSETQEVLRTLAARRNTSVAIVSGRGLEDVRGLVAIDTLIYVGNHGLEIRGPGISFTEPTAERSQRVIGLLAVALKKGLAHFTGAFVENKYLTISVHFRRVADADKELVFRHVQATVAVMPESFDISVGNHVFEVRPRVDWHKGSSMCWIASKLPKPNALTLYFGDDRTDEDAFRAFGDGITVKVGERGETSAHYHLDGPNSVREFLGWLVKVGDEGGKP